MFRFFFSYSFIPFRYFVECAYTCIDRFQLHEVSARNTLNYIYRCLYKQSFGTYILLFLLEKYCENGKVDELH